MYSLPAPSSQALVDNISLQARCEEAMATATVTNIVSQALGTLQDGNTAQMQMRSNPANGLL
ncbi:MAG: hypothetical protein R3D55_23360 [Chloroflexota bacterium]